MVEARGEIFTIPATVGDVRNLTNTSGSAEIEPAWSADGKWISYFSDKSGEYKLVIEAADGASADSNNVSRRSSAAELPSAITTSPGRSTESTGGWGWNSERRRRPTIIAPPLRLPIV